MTHTSVAAATSTRHRVHAAELFLASLRASSIVRAASTGLPSLLPAPYFFLRSGREGTPLAFFSSAAGVGAAAAGAAGAAGCRKYGGQHAVSRPACDADTSPAPPHPLQACTLCTVLCTCHPSPPQTRAHLPSLAAHTHTNAPYTAHPHMLMIIQGTDLLRLGVGAQVQLSRARVVLERGADVGLGRPAVAELGLRRVQLGPPRLRACGGEHLGGRRGHTGE